MKNYKEILKKIIDELTDEQINSIIERNNKLINKNYFPIERQRCFYVNTMGLISSFNYKPKDARHNQYRKLRNLFLLEEDALGFQKYLNIEYEIIEIAKELGIPTKEDWKNSNIKKYALGYEFSTNKIKLGEFNDIKGNAIHCKSKYFLQECRNKIAKVDLKFYLTY